MGVDRPGAGLDQWAVAQTSARAVSSPETMRNVTHPDRLAPRGFVGMSLVLYSHSSRLGGAELAAPALAEQLGAELWTRAAAHAEQAETRGVACRLLPPSWDRRPRGPLETARALAAVLAAQWRLMRAIAADRPDAVIANNIQGALHVLAGCLVTRTPLVIYVRDLGLGGNRPAREVAAYRFLLARVAAGRIFNSDLTRRSWGLDDDRPTVVVPTAVRDEFFDRPRRPRPDEVLMLGRIAAWKGQAHVVRAIERLQGLPPVRLRIVGGALFGDQVDLPEHSFPLEVTGHRERPWEDMETATAVLHASVTPEPFGQVLAQAAAAGVPIVCSDRGGQMEWLKDGFSCSSVDPLDEKALAAAVADVVLNPEAARRRAERARERAEAFREKTAYAELRPWLVHLLDSRRHGRG